MQRPLSAIATEPYGDPGPQWVVGRAEAELVARYGFLDDGELGLTAAMFDAPVGAFLVARRAGSAGPPVGGVGLRTVAPGTGEVRRLWVDPTCRGHGVGRSLMAALEHTARRGIGLTVLRLGTGDRQPEAVALYEATGWQRVHLDTDGRPVPVCSIRFAKHLT